MYPFVALLRTRTMRENTCCSGFGTAYPYAVGTGHPSTIFPHTSVRIQRLFSSYP